MFESVLIANRGEIACRVIRTARAMGLRTIAVYSEADVAALHVALADEAYCIGPAPAAESYLNGTRILEAAARAGAEAIHPGYGFLSENAGFAEACARAGIVFVGPPPAAIRAMGSKSEAKSLMAEAGVPLVPGYHGADQDPALLAERAAEIGYPVLIKAAAGGGGKGMRRVDAPERFAEALGAARREAAGAFGDDRVLLERYLERPRHIEIQVFADSHGNVVHLFERDCSIQRRHQKVFEEAPAPGMTADRRAAMGAAATAAARAIGYVGAGTFEFIVEGEAFYFMEMNTRLQVEHPVTEMITGQDLVAWQLAVAAGEPLPLSQDALTLRGHAIEARVYAEDPARGFLPATGRLAHFATPPEGRHVRVDTGVKTGDDISIHYDPMLAKLIVWDRDRAAALRRLRRALDGLEAVGLATNLGFLAAVAAHPAYTAAAVDTGFIERHKADLLPPEPGLVDDLLACAALAVLLQRREAAAAEARASADPHSPWHGTTGWRLNGLGRELLRFIHGAAEHAVPVRYGRGELYLDLPGGSVRAAVERAGPAALRVELGGARRTVTAVHSGLDVTILDRGRSCRLRLVDPIAAVADEPAAGGRLVAPMPGTVVRVAAAAGQRAAKGVVLMVLEAMKMEHAIAAPVDGVVTAVHFAEGDLVEEGAELLSFEAVAGVAYEG
jgi:3-methylcrotonyl-CoA carboxylase alpha subunit